MRESDLPEMAQNAFVPTHLPSQLVGSDRGAPESGAEPVAELHDREAAHDVLRKGAADEGRDARARGEVADPHEEPRRVRPPRYAGGGGPQVCDRKTSVTH